MPLANAERQARYRQRAAAALRFVKALGSERISMPKFIEVSKNDFVNLDLVSRIYRRQVGKGPYGEAFVFVGPDGKEIAHAAHSFDPRLVEGLLTAVKEPLRSDTAAEPEPGALASQETA